ncbi:ANTAR domain-containing protein [Clostridiaceae bacterium]|nr:ANTAR domain-containing protein [Clostridiaceae bacterium]NBI80758.1 ANTAR domain-containing protein [Clostridiaceae bacterium]
MELALLASASDKANQPLAKALTGSGSAERILTAKSGAEARRLLLDQEVSLLVINAPLPDEFGHELALTAAHTTSAGVLLLVKEEICEAAADKVEPDGVLVLPKPLNRALFYQSLRFLRAARSRMAGLQDENRKLQRKIEEIKTVDRAKCILIECCGMTEPEAHAFIEKSAMDKRITKLAAAKEVLDGGAPSPA